MSVLFLCLYPEEAASPRYRVGQFLPYLRGQGIECEVAAPLSVEDWRRHSGPDRQGRACWYHLKETPQRLRQLLTARRYNVVFVQKALMSAYLRGMPALLSACADRVIYDFDDAVHLQPPHALRFPWRFLENRRQIFQIMNQAEVVLAGNRWLADEAESHARRVEYFPTVVDTDRFSPGAAPEKFCAGWIGSPSTTPALEVMGDGCGMLEAGALRLVGAHAESVHCPNATVVPWALEREVAEVRGFSVGLFPQRKDAWTRGKCALKALLYMACGVPCIATPYGAVLDMIEDGENGLFADSPEAWASALERLRDSALRQRMGAAARASVESRFSLRKAAPRLQAILEETG